MRDRNKLPQVVGDENQKAILVDPRGWARERFGYCIAGKRKGFGAEGQEPRQAQGFRCTESCRPGFSIKNLCHL